MRDDEAQATPGDDETLSRLEQRLDRASAAAERLIAQAAHGTTRKPPPAGWQQAAPGVGQGTRGGGRGPGGGDHGRGDGDHGARDGAWGGDGFGDDPQRAGPESQLGAELDLLIGILGSLLDRIPAELQQRLADAVREVLLALRALIDWYLERSERTRAQPAEVQDIPIL